jgi:hypothetical protein
MLSSKGNTALLGKQRFLKVYMNSIYNQWEAQHKMSRLLSEANDRRNLNIARQNPAAMNDEPQSRSQHEQSLLARIRRLFGQALDPKPDRTRSPKSKTA